MDLDRPKNRFGKCACACCGYFTISQIYDTCEVCFWEEDYYQESQTSDHGGPNSVCLVEARDNFIKFGAIEACFINTVRKPTEEEKIGN